jgi:hypothetical protein
MGGLVSLVTELAALLHSMRCQSLWWSADCREPDGGRHARATWRPAVRAALADDDPALAVHDLVCDVHLDPCHECPNRERHAALLARAFDIPRKATP